MQNLYFVPSFYPSTNTTPPAHSTLSLLSSTPWSHMSCISQRSQAHLSGSCRKARSMTLIPVGTAGSNGYSPYISHVMLPYCKAAFNFKQGMLQLWPAISWRCTKRHPRKSDPPLIQCCLTKCSVHNPPVFKLLVDLLRQGQLLPRFIQ